MGDALKKGDTDMNAEKRFAERMQELVYDCGLKPEEISALCGVGLSRLRCWLSPRCASLPCTRSLVKLADFFGCSLLYLLRLEEENSLTRPRTNLPDFSKRLLFLKERHEIKIYMRSNARADLARLLPFTIGRKEAPCPTFTICLRCRTFSAARPTSCSAERTESR